MGADVNKKLWNLYQDFFTPLYYWSHNLLYSIIIVIVFCSLSWAKRDSSPYIGFIKQGTNPEYHVSFNSGIEQWEDQKRSTHRYQQWTLSCSYLESITNRDQTYCSLERMVLDDHRPTSPGVVVSTHNHSTLDGTLQILRADWNDGKLDFNFTYTDGSTAEVLIRMKYRGDIIYLESFKALGVARGIFSDSMVTIEYKIPEYTYILNVPIEMRGLKSEEDKKWDDMVKTLKKEDQQALDKLDKCKSMDTILSDKERLNKIFPDYEKIDKGQKEPTLEEIKKINEMILEEFSKCIADTGISKEGLTKVFNLLRDGMTEELQKEFKKK